MGTPPRHHFTFHIYTPLCIQLGHVHVRREAVQGLQCLCTHPVRQTTAPSSCQQPGTCPDPDWSHCFGLYGTVYIPPLYRLLLFIHTVHMREDMVFNLHLGPCLQHVYSDPENIMAQVVCNTAMTDYGAAGVLYLAQSSS